jgi:hypothetical protein
MMKFIFVPHPRSENRQQQSVLPAIEKIDFTKYDMILLGGDLTYYTSISRKSMDYCDSLFNLDSPNTLWTFGNHDTNNRALIKEYTGKESFYTYYRDSITFLVMDNELNSSGFTSSFISGDQLEMVKNVCDSISDSRFLVVLHSRLLWMIGNVDFSSRLDSVAESTKQLDTTNFYQDIFPLLQKVKAKGIQVICLGGDKSKINIEYSPEDSITFFTSTMAPEFADNMNDVMIFSYSKAENIMSWQFVPLDKVEKNTQNPVSVIQIDQKKPLLRFYREPGSNEISVQVEAGDIDNVLLNIYSINGVLCRSIRIKTNEKKAMHMNNPGLYVIKAFSGNSAIVEKVIMQ